jgi:hypothetical protein
MEPHINYYIFIAFCNEGHQNRWALQLDKDFISHLIKDTLVVALLFLWNHTSSWSLIKVPFQFLSKTYFKLIPMWLQVYSNERREKFGVVRYWEIKFSRKYSTKILFVQHVSNSRFAIFLFSFHLLRLIKMLSSLKLKTLICEGAVWWIYKWHPA